MVSPYYSLLSLIDDECFKKIRLDSQGCGSAFIFADSDPDPAVFSQRRSGSSCFPNADPDSPFKNVYKITL